LVRKQLTSDRDIARGCWCADNWLQYDDDVVRHYKDNDIKQLVGKGGADWHIAYLCFYRTKKPE
jgi:hypothetical protein